MRRPDAVRVDVILRVLVEAEHHAFEGIGVRAGDKRQPLVLRGAGGEHHQRDVLRREANQLGAHRLIATARHVGVLGCDFDLVRARRFRALRNLQQRREAAPDVRGAERDEERGSQGEGPQGDGVPLQPRAIDRHAVFDGAALRDGLLNKPFNQLLGLALFRRRRRLDGAQNRRLKRGIVLFQVERDLCVGHFLSQRQQRVGQERRRTPRARRSGIR